MASLNRLNAELNEMQLELPLQSEEPSEKEMERKSTISDQTERGRLIIAKRKWLLEQLTDAGSLSGTGVKTDG